MQEKESEATIKSMDYIVSELRKLTEILKKGIFKEKENEQRPIYKRNIRNNK